MLCVNVLSVTHIPTNKIVCVLYSIGNTIFHEIAKIAIFAANNCNIIKKLCNFIEALATLSCHIVIIGSAKDSLIGTPPSTSYIIASYSKLKKTYTNCDIMT